jgi:hypothetical protein
VWHQLYLAVQVPFPTRSLVSYFGRSRTGTDSSPSTFAFPLSVWFHQSFTLVFICTTSLKEGQTGEAWATSSRNIAYSEFGDHQDRKVLCFQHCRTRTYLHVDSVTLSFREMMNSLVLAGCTLAEPGGQCPLSSHCRGRVGISLQIMMRELQARAVATECSCNMKGTCT